MCVCVCLSHINSHLFEVKSRTKGKIFNYTKGKERVPSHLNTLILSMVALIGEITNNRNNNNKIKRKGELIYILFIRVTYA